MDAGAIVGFVLAVLVFLILMVGCYYLVRAKAGLQLLPIRTNLPAPAESINPAHQIELTRFPSPIRTDFAIIRGASSGRLAPIVTGTLKKEEGGDEVPTTPRSKTEDSDTITPLPPSTPLACSPSSRFVPRRLDLYTPSNYARGGGRGSAPSSIGRIIPPPNREVNYSVASIASMGSVAELYAAVQRESIG